MNEPPDLNSRAQVNMSMRIDKTKKLQNGTVGPKYLVMSRVNSDTTLANVSPFLLKKIIDYVCGGEIESCKKLRNGSILMKTKNFLQASKLIQLTALSQNIEVAISEHNYLNSSKGIIYSDDLRGLSDEDILNGMKDEHVTEIKKILKKQGDKLVETGLIILTFSKPDLPDKVKIGYESTMVRPYIPYPLRCFQCFKFGHTTKFCKLDKKCCNCSKAFHTNPETNEKCNNEQLCINCEFYNMEDRNHNTMDKKCPIFINEKEIQAIKTIQKVDNKKAREIFNERHPKNTSFASIVRPTVNYNTINLFENKSQSSNTSVTQTTSTKPQPTNICSPNDQPKPNSITLGLSSNPSCSHMNPKLSQSSSKTKILPRNLSKRKKAELKAKLRKTPISKSFNSDIPMDLLGSDDSFNEDPTYQT